MTNNFRKRVIRTSYKGNKRNFKDPQYVEFRKYIRKRDKNQCQFPNCRKKGREVHHIKTWEKYPLLRFEKSNGVLLCVKCHRLTKGKEEKYEFLLSEIVRKNEKIYGKN